MRYASALLLLAASGCIGPLAPGPSEEELTAADYGPPPYDYRKSVLEYADALMILFIRVEISRPRKAWYGKTELFGKPRDVRFGWAVDFRGYEMTDASPKLAAEVTYYFRDGMLEAITDKDGFRSVGKDVYADKGRGD